MTSKRELIEPTPGDKRYVRRDEDGQFKEVVDVGKSLAADSARRQRPRSSQGRVTGAIDRGGQALTPREAARALSTRTTTPSSAPWAQAA